MPYEGVPYEGVPYEGAGPGTGGAADHVSGPVPAVGGADHGLPAVSTADSPGIARVGRSTSTPHTGGTGAVTSAAGGRVAGIGDVWPGSGVVVSASGRGAPQGDASSGRSSSVPADPVAEDGVGCPPWD